MERLLEIIISDFFNYIKLNEKIEMEIDDLNLKLITENDNKCLARIWDNERKNPNLRCNREGKFNGLCKTHFVMRPLRFKLITEDPPEFEMLKTYRIHNPNVDNEIKIFSTNKIELFRRKEIEKVIKDKEIVINKPMNSSTINFKQVINNLKTIIIEKRYPLDVENILKNIITDYKLEKINESKKEHIRHLIEENFIDIEIEYNKIKAEEEKKKLENKKKKIKVKLTGKKIEDTNSYITSSTFKSNIPSYDSEDEDDFDIDKSLSMKELMLEYTDLINEYKLKIPNNYYLKKDVRSVRIVDIENQSDLICYEFHSQVNDQDLFSEKELININNENKENKVILINQNGSIIGEKRKWIDTNLPNEYKNNEEQVLHPETCLPLDEYEIYRCSSMFHNLTPRIYREYKWDDLFNGLQATNEIYDQIEEE